MEGRRRVKEQLKKMGSFEYYQTSFSYTDQETGEERFVGVPEQGGRDLISADPLAPGHRLHGRRDRRRHRGAVPRRGLGRERDRQAEARRRRRRRDEGVDPPRVQLPADAQGRAGHRAATWTRPTSTSRSSTCSATASRPRSAWRSSWPRYSALRKAPVAPALLVLGDMSVQGNIKPLRSLVEPLQVAMDNGAKRALHPDREQAQLPGRARRRRRARGPDLLRRPEDGGDEGAGAGVGRHSGLMRPSPSRHDWPQAPSTGAFLP